jgi:predicted chitinase
VKIKVDWEGRLMPAATEVPTIYSVLTALLLGGLLGLLGQGIRAVVGLKNAGALSSTTPTQQSVFSAAYLCLSLLIGFIVGVLASITLNLQNAITVDPSNWKILLGIIASGYVGADFIENAMSLVIPGAQPVAPTAASAPPPAAAPAVVSPPRPATLPAPPLATPDQGAAALTAAMRIVSPQVNTGTWVPALIAAFAKYDLSNERRRAAALGQFLVEAGPAFKEVVENLNYSAERAAHIFPTVFSSAESAQQYVGDQQRFGNHVYANKNGNGDEASGDGFRFRGRGLIQLTGRTEYTEFGSTIGKTAEDAAAYCETTEGAAVSGCWYLANKGCLPLADAWNIDGITLRVNGRAMVGKVQREEYSNDMLKHLGGD